MRIFCLYFWREIGYKISCFFNPRQKWLKIPRDYHDKPELIEHCLFTCLIHYCEVELENFKNISPDYLEMVSENWAAHYQEVQELYQIIKFDLPLLRIQLAEIDENLHATDWLERSWPISEKIVSLSQDCCERIVKTKGFLWT